jgi:hypothetical protein
VKNIFVIVLIVLAGCKATGVDGSHKDSMTVSQSDPTRLALPSPAPAEIVPAPAGVPAPTASDLERVRSETFASNTAQQNEITGLGVQLGKVGEHVEGVHAELSARLDNVVNATADIKVAVNQRIESQATLNASAVAELRAEFRAEISAQAQVQAEAVAGIGNKLNSIQTTSTTSSALNSGRDSISFTPEMAQMIIDMSRDDSKTLVQVQHEQSNALTYIVGALCGVMTLLAELRSRRSENQHRDLLKTVAPDLAITEGKRETWRFVRVPPPAGAPM